MILDVGASQWRTANSKDGKSIVLSPDLVRQSHSAAMVGLHKVALLGGTLGSDSQIADESVYFCDLREISLGAEAALAKSTATSTPVVAAAPTTTPTNNTTTTAASPAASSVAAATTDGSSADGEMSKDDEIAALKKQVAILKVKAARVRRGTASASDAPPPSNFYF